jgi:hypothetical protein
MRLPPLWTCPLCGNKFVTANMWHSCGRWKLSDHFRGTDPLVRRTFERFLKIARLNGPVRVVVQKTRICFQVRMRFGGAVTRKKWLQAALVLFRPVSHPRLNRTEFFTPHYHVHHFRFDHPDQLDEPFSALVRESYAIGCQEQLARRRA